MSDSQKDKTATYMVQHRSPSFSKEEVNTLVNLVQKYKHIILNKSTNSTSNHAKEVAWIKISKEMNKQGFKYVRNTDSLKTKWENLKKEARKCSKNLMNIKSTESSEIIYPIVSMINEMDMVNNRADKTHGLLQEDNDEEEDKNSSKLSDNNDDKHSDDSDASDGEKQDSSRALNFSPQECSLLLKCIRDEKKHIFSKEATGKAIKLKNNAWSRISYAFNKLSPTKRTTKVLRTKFNNMKKNAKNVGFNDLFSRNQHTKLEAEHSSKIVKKEPPFEYQLDVDTDPEHDDDEEDTFQELPNFNKNHLEFSDPLSTVLNGDSGIDSMSHFGSATHENKEVVKLKMELLKYKLETAKLERQRLQELMEAESAERQSRAIETSLRLRAARINAVSAEMSLPPTHPALHYNEKETLAQQYMQFANNS